jgi:hypothetical protein
MKNQLRELKIAVKTGKPTAITKVKVGKINGRYNFKLMEKENE